MSFNKRFNKEIQNYQTDNLVEEKGKYNSRVPGCTLINHICSTTEKSATFQIKISNSISFTVKIIVEKYYPFREPSVFVNGKDYRSFYNCLAAEDTDDINLHYFNYYYKRIVGDKDGNYRCPCCTSVLCGDNWHIHIGFSGILQEMRDNIVTHCRVVELIHAQKIMDKYLGFNLPTIFQMI